MIFAVITFPGSNCDRDCHDVLKRVLGYSVTAVFHKEHRLGKCDAVIIPGGFSYGDYLRAGALAKLSPIMEDVRNFAAQGGLVLGICNGFQVLCETGLLPGALVRNRSLKFASMAVDLRVENASTAFTSEYQTGDILKIPIAHGEGCYTADSKTIESLETEGRVLFRYVGPVRPDMPDGNPNGSINAIAGIMNAKGNVMGLMPHPERATDALISISDGAGIFRSMALAVERLTHRQPSVVSV
jgi:phosphoribosylformylglycinamidine synthase subunit PurQ / glutaminase